jgi:hypothetical protein
MSEPRPHRWAVSAVDAATLLLPPGPVRRRYRAELVSELWGMTSGQQLGHALSTLAAAPALHRALVEAGELEVPHSPLWCRARLHHQWHPAVTDDGERYRRCRACGMDDDGTSRRRVAGSMIAAHGVTQY